MFCYDVNWRTSCQSDREGYNSPFRTPSTPTAFRSRHFGRLDVSSFLQTAATSTTGFELLFLCFMYSRLVESHSGARRNILAGPPNIFTGALWGENFRIFLFKIIHSGVFYISGRWRGPQTSWGPA